MMEYSVAIKMVKETLSLYEALHDTLVKKIRCRTVCAICWLSRTRGENKCAYS